jgi:hypothetical protein
VDEDVQDIQAMDPSAIFGTPGVSGIAFSLARFGFPYPEGNSCKSRHARHLAQGRLAKNIGGMTIEIVGLETGPSGPSGTRFHSSDVRNKDIRNSKRLRFDLYRRISQAAALEWGRHNNSRVTIRNIPKELPCPF